jgi:hypothetical protein
VDASISFKTAGRAFQLDRQRINVLFATLRDGTFTNPEPRASLDERQ